MNSSNIENNNKINVKWGLCQREEEVFNVCVKQEKNKKTKQGSETEREREREREMTDEHYVNVWQKGLRDVHQFWCHCRHCGGILAETMRDRAGVNEPVSEGNGKRVKGWKDGELRKKEHLLWSDRDQRASSTQAVSLAKKLTLLGTSTSKAASQPPRGGSSPATELTSLALPLCQLCHYTHYTERKWHERGAREPLKQLAGLWDRVDVVRNLLNIST